MLFTQLGLGVIILFAFIFLIIPGIYASVVLSLVIIIRVLENKNFSQAISRSVELIKENWWFTLGFLLVMYLIVGIMSLVFQIPVYILLFVTAFQSADPTAIVGESGFLFSLSMAWSALATFLYAIFPVGLVFHYFNLVEKKEAKGLKERIEQI
jgi:type III secretory pathway component EscU